MIPEPHLQGQMGAQRIEILRFVATPRRANLLQMRQHAQRTHYIQFGYSPSQHFWTDMPESNEEGEVFFAGGCDDDRAPYFKALIEARIRPALYGGYWSDHEVFRPYFRGMANLSDMRRLHAEIPISVCLVRRANRDGHVMRTFEAPAMGACLAMEDTEEHRAIFGPDGENVVYFSDPASLVLVCKQLLIHLRLDAAFVKTVMHSSAKAGTLTQTASSK